MLSEGACRAVSNLQMQYTLGACEEVQASVHAHRASSAEGEPRRAGQANGAGPASSMPAPCSRIGEVAAAVTIDFTDRVPLENAQAGLERTEVALRTVRRRQMDESHARPPPG